MTNFFGFKISSDQLRTKINYYTIVGTNFNTVCLYFTIHIIKLKYLVDNILVD